VKKGFVNETTPYEALRGVLLAGARDVSDSGKRVFFDYLKAVAAYEEFGFDREMLIFGLEDAEKKDLFSSVQLRFPWVTDVFIYGILAGEEAQNDAKRGLLARYAEFPETAAEAGRALSLDRTRMVADALGRQSTAGESALDEIRSVLDGGKWADSAELLSEVRWCLKYLPPAERAEQIGRVLGALKRKSEEKGDGAETFSRFCGRYSAVPFVLNMDAAYAEFSKVSLPGMDLREYFVRNKSLWFEASDVYQAALTNALNRCSLTALPDKNLEIRIRNEVETVCRSNDTRSVLALREVPSGIKERIANGIVGMELLWALSRQSANRMNARGSGAIPAFNLAGRVTRDGRTIEASKSGLYSVDGALDAMVMRAICQLQAGRAVNGVNISTYEPFREYMEGLFSDKYLTALIDNAIANKRYTVVRPKGALPVVTIPIDAPANTDDGGEGRSPLIDMIPGKKCAPPDDYLNFVFAVTKRFAPTMWQYLRLVECGISASDIERLRGKGMSELADKYDPGDLVSKGDALKMVGAKTPHLVERERAALLKALDGVAGIDFQEMARKLKKSLEKRGVK